MITEDPVLTKLLSNKNQCTTISVSDKNNNENQLISHIITRVQNTSHHESGLLVGVIRFMVATLCHFLIQGHPQK